MPARLSRRSVTATALGALLCGALLHVPQATPAAAATAAAAGPTVTVPPAGSHGFPFLAAAEDLGSYGYTESEYFFSGTATSYAKSGLWTSDGRWNVRASGTAAYKSRLLVRRPADPAKFNGTVVVEWLNVSGQIDLSRTTGSSATSCCARATPGSASRPRPSASTAGPARSRA